MVKPLFRLGLLALATWLVAAPIRLAQAQLVREIDPNCTPALTPRSELLLPYIDEYIGTYGADVSPDGKRLAVAAVNRVVLFDTVTFEPVQRIAFEPEYQDSPRVLAWAPDNVHLAVYIGPRNGTLIFNAATAEVEQRLPTDDYYTMNAYSLVWSPDSDKLAVLGALPWRVWDVDSGEIVYQQTLASNSRYVSYLSPLIYGHQYMAAWSPDGSELAMPLVVPDARNLAMPLVASDTRNVVLLDTTTWSEASALPVDFGGIVTLEWSNAGRLYVTNANHTLAVWNPATEERITELRPGPGYIARLSLDQRQLATAKAQSITILDADSLETITVLTGQTWGSISNLHWLDDQRIIIYGEYSSVEVWNIATGVMEHTWHINCI